MLCWIMILFSYNFVLCAHIYIYFVYNCYLLQCIIAAQSRELATDAGNNVNVVAAIAVDASRFDHFRVALNDF